jgi:hypothetical protein
MTGVELVVIALGLGAGFVLVRLLIASATRRQAEPATTPAPAPVPARVTRTTAPPAPAVSDPDPPMDALFQVHLTQVVRDHGPRVGDQPKRLQGLLLDQALGRHRREIGVIVAAARLGVHTLLATGEALAMPRAEALLKTQGGMDAALAAWAVRAWATALREARTALQG